MIAAPALCISALRIFLRVSTASPLAFDKWRADFLNRLFLTAATCHFHQRLFEMSIMQPKYGWSFRDVGARLLTCSYCGTSCEFPATSAYEIYELELATHRCPRCASLTVDPSTLLSSPTELLGASPSASMTTGVKYYLEAGYSAEFITACALACVPHEFRGNEEAVFVDIGAGYGLSSYFVQTILRSPIIAVEPGSWGEFGARDLGLPIHRALFEELPTHVLKSLENKRVLLHLNSVVEHLHAPLASVQSIMRIAKVDVLAAVVPDADSINNEDPFIAHVGTLAPGDHLHLPTSDGMKIFLGRLGFEYVAVKKMGALLIAVGAHRPISLPDDSEIKDHTRRLLERLANLPNEHLRLGAKVRALGIAVWDCDREWQNRLITELPVPRWKVGSADEIPYCMPMAAFYIGSYWLQSGDLKSAHEWFCAADTTSERFQHLHPGCSAAAIDFGWVARLFRAHVAACLGDCTEAQLCLEKVIDSQRDLIHGAKPSIVASAVTQLAELSAARAGRQSAA